MAKGKLRAGQLDKQVTIEKPSTTVTVGDGRGERITSWTTHQADIWASIEPLRGREYFASGDRSQHDRHEATHRVGIRYLAGVTPDMRVAYGSRLLHIVAVLNVNEQDRDMELMCTETTEAT